MSTSDISQNSEINTHPPPITPPPITPPPITPPPITPPSSTITPPSSTITPPSSTITPPSSTIPPPSSTITPSSSTIPPPSSIQSSSTTRTNEINFHMTRSTRKEIREILNNNMLEDLKLMLEKRGNFNKANIILIYLFYIFQYSGILTTTIATKYSKDEIVWFGIGLNLLASFIHSAININKNISEKLFNDIESILNNKYVDETNIDMEEKV